MANKVDLVHIRRVVVEHTLSHEVIVSRSLRVKLKADDSEALTSNQSVLRIRLESLGLI